MIQPKHPHYPYYPYPYPPPWQQVSRSSEMSDNVNNTSLKLSKPTPTDPTWILSDNVDLKFVLPILDPLVLDRMDQREDVE